MAGPRDTGLVVPKLNKTRAFKSFLRVPTCHASYQRHHYHHYNLPTYPHQV